MKLKAGDIFTIPINGDKSGFGQIVEVPNKNNFIIIVFEEVYDNQQLPVLAKVISSKVLFFGYTMDALLYHKYWKIVGNSLVNLEKIKMPYYKLGSAGDFKLVNHKGDFISKISKEKFEKLNYHEIIAPIRYENAFKAYHGIGEWHDDYDELLYSKVLEGISFIEG